MEAKPLRQRSIARKTVGRRVQEAFDGGESHRGRSIVGVERRGADYPVLPCNSDKKRRGQENKSEGAALARNCGELTRDGSARGLGPSTP